MTCGGLLAPYLTTFSPEPQSKAWNFPCRFLKDIEIPVNVSSSLQDVLSGVDDRPGGGSSREMLHLLRQQGLVLLLRVKPASGVYDGAQW